MKRSSTRTSKQAARAIALVTAGLCGFASGCNVINNDLLFAGPKGDAGVDSSDAAGNQQMPTAAGQLVITEFMASPSTGNAGEYIELYNPGPNTYDLMGCEIGDNDPDRGHVISSSVMVAPGAYVSLAYSDATGAGFAPTYSYAGTFKIGTVDIVALKCAGVQIDIVDFMSTMPSNTFPVTDRYAMTLSPSKLDATANDNAANWCVASYREYHTGDFGTPGGANQACGAVRPSAAGQLVITEINPKPTNGQLSEYVELYNPGAVTYDLLDCTISDSNTGTPATITKSLAIAPGKYVTLGYSDSASAGFPLDYSYVGHFNLGSPADEVHVGCGGTELDAVLYNSSFTQVDGRSMQVKNTALTSTLNDTNTNWCATGTIAADQFLPGNYGTPGRANDCP